MTTHEPSTGRTSTLIGRRIGNLEIVSQIGQGGVGEVYRAEHVGLGTPYAVKVLHPSVARDNTIIERFRREAIACARLRHPNVVFVTDFGLKEGLGIYIIMEYLEGCSLTKMLGREGQLELTRMGRIGMQMCDALEAAHRMGIVHRDLKPDNVHVRSVVGQPDQIKVLDFGIALLSGAAALTAAGTTVGSPHYMSPEQVQGLSRQIGPGSDIYSLGVIFYQMLTNTWPLWSDNLFELCRMHLVQVPPPVSAWRAELAGTRLESLIAAMLAKRIEERPASMDAVAKELKEAMTELGVSLGKQPVDAAEAESGTDFGPTLSAELSPSQFRILHISHSLRASLPETPLQEALRVLTSATKLSDALFCRLILGMAAPELAAAPPGSDHFNKALAQIDIITDAALEHSDQAEHRATLVAIGVVLSGLSAERQRTAFERLAPHLQHPAFPQQALPEWARVETTDTWMPTPEPDDATTLMSKLRQPISLQSMKAVLTHKIGGQKSES